MSKGKLESIIKISATTELFSVTDSGGTDGIDIAAADYYLSSAGTGSWDLIETIQRTLNSSVTLNGTYTVTMSSAGIVTISCNESCSATWTSTALRNMLGYTANLTSGTSHVATEQAEAVWYPDGEYQTLNGGGTWQGYWETEKYDLESPSGYVYSLSGEKKRVLDIRWPAISRARTWIANESTANESFEAFFKNCVRGEASWAQSAGPVRWHADETDDAAYYTYKVVGLANWRPDTIRENWTGHWAISLPRLVQVPSEVS